MWSLDPLTCHNLVRPYCYVKIDPANYLFICYVLLLAIHHHFVMLSLKPSMIHLTLWLSYLREPCLVLWNQVPHRPMVGATSRIHPLRAKCHTEQSATPHGGGHLLKPMGATSWVCRAITVMLTYSRKLIILNKLQLVWVWEEVMDTGMTPYL